MIILLSILRILSSMYEVHVRTYVLRRVKAVNGMSVLSTVVMGRKCCIPTCVNHRNVLREQVHRFPANKKV